MRSLLTGLVVVTFTLPAVADEPRTVTFAKADADRLPAGWKAAKTGPGEGSVWKVTAEPAAPSKTGFALTQLAAGPNPLYNLCLLDGSRFADGELTATLKAVSGKTDQGGGVLWRGRDANNYYVCRYNPLEENLRVYHVKDGKRTQLATKEGLSMPAEKWFTVSVRHRGDRIECRLNGELHLSVADATFPGPGLVGMWTKADAVTAFDKLVIAPAGQ